MNPRQSMHRSNLACRIRDCRLADAPAIAEIYNESVVVGTIASDVFPVTAGAIAEKISRAFT